MMNSSSDSLKYVGFNRLLASVALTQPILLACCCASPSRAWGCYRLPGSPTQRSAMVTFRPSREGRNVAVLGCFCGSLARDSAQRGRSKSALLAGPARKPSFLVHAPVRWRRCIVASGCTGVNLRSGDGTLPPSFFSQAGRPNLGLRFPAADGQKRGICCDLYRWPTRIEALL